MGIDCVTRGKENLPSAERQTDAPNAAGPSGIFRTSFPAGDQRLAEVAGEIGAIMRRTGLDRTLAIGALVLDRFFDGSVDLWRDRRNHKNNSVRRLAQRPDCPLSRSSLNQAIGIHAVTKALPCVLALAHIDSSHIGAVLSLSPPDQERWLTQANAARWNVRQLKDGIRAERAAQGERRGRPRASEQQRLAAAARSLIGRLEAVIEALASESSTLEIATREFLALRLTTMISHLRGTGDLDPPTPNPFPIAKIGAVESKGSPKRVA
jgi:hypothetical protein